MDPVNDDNHRFGLPGYDATTYGEAFADVYDLWYDDLDDDDFIEVLCSVLPPRPARILELGVGTGRLLARLADARRAVVDEMTGVDSSTRMLARARTRLGDGANLVAADFSESLPEGVFDLVFVGYNTLFNLPDDAALRSCLALVAGCLGPGGSFCTDTTCPAPHTRDEQVSVHTTRAGEEVESISRHDRESQRITGRFVHRAEGTNVRVRPWAVRYWHPHQMDAVARSTGLELISRLAEGHHSPDSSSADHASNSLAGDSGTGGRSISLYRVATGNLREQ